jgi:integrase
MLGLVFTTPRGTPLDPRNTSRAWYAFLDRAGLRHIRLHDIRHTAISLALAQGASLEDAKRMARHKTIRQTSDTYGHLVKARQREVAGMLDRAVAG